LYSIVVIRSPRAEYLRELKWTRPSVGNLQTEWKNGKSAASGYSIQRAGWLRWAVCWRCSLGRPHHNYFRGAVKGFLRHAW